MPKSKIPQPSGNLPTAPDQFTKLATDYTAETADNRILHINLCFFRYGTSDQAHAGAILLSLVILIVMVLLVPVGAFSSNITWIDRVFGWLGSAFLVVAGVAIGRGSVKQPKGKGSKPTGD